MQYLVESMHNTWDGGHKEPRMPHNECNNSQRKWKRMAGRFASSRPVDEEDCGNKVINR